MIDRKRVVLNKNLELIKELFDIPITATKIEEDTSNVKNKNICFQILDLFTRFDKLVLYFEQPEPKTYHRWLYYCDLDGNFFCCRLNNTSEILSSLNKTEKYFYLFPQIDEHTKIYRVWKKELIKSKK